MAWGKEGHKSAAWLWILENDLDTKIVINGSTFGALSGWMDGDTTLKLWDHETSSLTIDLWKIMNVDVDILCKVINDKDNTNNTVLLNMICLFIVISKEESRESFSQMDQSLVIVHNIILYSGQTPAWWQCPGRRSCSSPPPPIGGYYLAQCPIGTAQ